MPTPTDPREPLPRLRVANADFVTDRVVVGGDLHPDHDTAVDQAHELVSAGVTHVLDARIEWRDDEVWAGFPGVSYRWDGIDDRGQRVPEPWFEDVVRWCLTALEDPDAVLLAHCHMGINRGPSVGLAVLLGLGWDLVEALDAIRRARPVAFVAYAEDALRWHHVRTDADDATRRADRERLARWRRENELDVASVIRRVRGSEPQR